MNYNISKKLLYIEDVTFLVMIGLNGIAIQVLFYFIARNQYLKRIQQNKKCEDDSYTDTQEVAKIMNGELSK